MGGIPHPEREFAIVSRICSQMPFETSQFKATECYAAFTTILCWTLQRIRSREYPLDELYDELRTSEIRRFCDLQPVAYDDGRLQARDETHGAMLNDLSVFRTDDGRSFGVLEVMISLRNAVAHPEGLRVYPVNRRGFLIGFRFDCRRPGGNDLERWEGPRYQLYLTRNGMTQIAQTLGHRYCDAFGRERPTVEQHARHLVEQ
ncbi:hypothetical protein [Tranquillimonas rosea]|uniref:hypothetical protein n=1 Tax=Tranquillimonas rosea TaxID=641238 RepID=UPI001160A4C1|nr:hypothetical protein [Tranquillimonas rosea]